MTRRPVLLARACALWCALSLTSLPVGAQDPAGAVGATPRPAPANELDAFMEKVLARREVNRKTLDQYILDETESFEILGPGRWPLYRTKRDFTWYVRDGMHVRSPVRYNGVKIGEEARQRYETNWIRRERERQERARKKEQEEKEGKGAGKAGDKESGKDAEPKPGSDSGIAIGPEGVQVSVGGSPMPTEPRFVSEAYFMDFKFEAGNYYLAGREKLEGHDVLKIEYYPTQMFADSDEHRDDSAKNEKKAAEQKRDPKQAEREKKAEEDIERR